MIRSLGGKIGLWLIRWALRWEIPEYQIERIYNPVALVVQKTIEKEIHPFAAEQVLTNARESLKNKAVKYIKHEEVKDKEGTRLVTMTLVVQRQDI